ncbi:PP2C family protein-serine/threonine phosphatase [Streptomyces sp. NPDC008343]|uniref:PP2C family protein-serine/threonine phosphatase n=1 Tax=Streptomyces sp. NPDC008343 TaxID=3364828 RepID=UPI0036E3621F
MTALHSSRNRVALVESARVNRIHDSYDLRCVPLIAVPLALIACIVLADLSTPSDIRFTPLLVVAPTITASFAGAWLTAGVSVLAVAAELVTDLTERPPHLNETVATASLIAVSAFVVVFAHLRLQYSRRYDRAQSHALAAQQAVLRPLPTRLGNLEIASVYLPAEADAVVGGDLYAAARTDKGSRLLIGDVRGKGLSAVGEAALVLGAFHATAHRAHALVDLVSALDGALGGIPGRSCTDGDDEHFVTALLLEVPDDAGPITATSCGHPPPILVRDGQPVIATLPEAAPPLGLQLAPNLVQTGSVAWMPDDIVLLCTDGVLEARDHMGRFYPLLDRIRTWSGGTPESLISHLHTDLLRYTGGGLNDDTALVAFRSRHAPVVSAHGT